MKGLTMKLLLAFASIYTFWLGFWYFNQPPIEQVSAYTPSPLLLCERETYASEVFCQTNEYRVNNGLHQLLYSAEAERTAKARAEHLCETSTFTHDGWTDFVRFEYIKAGENLAKGFNSPQEAFTALVNSPTHLDNIVGDWTHSGVYTEPCGGRNITVSIFMKV